MVTEEALHVSPDVLGLPLAGPWRRAGAITVDTILVSLLTGTPSVLFGLAAAYVLFRVSGRSKPGAGYIRRSFRFTFRLSGAMVLFLVAISLWDSARDRLRGDDEEGAVRASVAVEAGGPHELALTGRAAVSFAADMLALGRASDEEEAARAARRILGSMRTAGLPPTDAHEALREFASSGEGKPWIGSAVDRVIAEELAADTEQEEEGEGQEIANAPDEAPAESLIVAYAAALSAADSAAADSLRPSVVALLASDTVGALATTISGLHDEQEELRSQIAGLEEEIGEGPGLMATIRAYAEDLGLGLGWFGLYFTATTAMWRGRTPGKRVFGIRVISLTGRPIGWWAAFERFGGYAAGFATGLLGFLQVFWDDNRQAIHDKIAVTVVIRD